MIAPRGMWRDSLSWVGNGDGLSLALTGWQKSKVDVKQAVTACSSLTCWRKLPRSRPASSKCNVAVTHARYRVGAQRMATAGCGV